MLPPVLALPSADLVLGYLPAAVSADGARVDLAYELRTRDGEVLESFTEVVELPAPADGSAPRPVDDRFRAVARLLSLVAALSYAKTVAPATYDTGMPLTRAEHAFLTAVVAGGLGEFAYRNDLPGALTPAVVPAPVDDADAPADPPANPSADTDGAPARAGALVAVGGGKDSIVTLEALRDAGVPVVLFSVGTYAPIERTAATAGLPLLSARRRLDPRLGELNAAGAHNGHVPVTAVNSLVAALTALRCGLDTVVFSNERSSSYGNLTWGGHEVNHQWSKGLAAERLVHDLLAPHGLTYVSFLRPLSEIAIMRRFATLTRYRDVFTSCNRAFHLDPAKRTGWCGACPKCRFVFLVLAPFVPRADLLGVFGGRDLLADPAQREEFLDLLGTGAGHKPFECVGEPDECRRALTLLRKHPDWTGHPLWREPGFTAADVDEPEGDLLSFSPDHLLPPDLEAVARAVL